MSKKTLRKVQPAHKSDKVTVSQAKKAWLEIARDRSGAGNQDDHSKARNEMKPGNSGDHER